MFKKLKMPKMPKVKMPDVKVKWAKLPKQLAIRQKVL